MSANAAVCAALTRIARARKARLTTRGRRTGLPRRVTIWFVVDDEGVALGTLDAQRHWVRNALRDPHVELEVEGVRLRGRLLEASDPGSHARLRERFATKYWLAWIASWFGLGQRSTFRVLDLELISEDEPAMGAAEVPSTRGGPGPEATGVP